MPSRSKGNIFLNGCKDRIGKCTEINFLLEIFFSMPAKPFKDIFCFASFSTILRLTRKHHLYLSVQTCFHHCRLSEKYEFFLLSYKIYKNHFFYLCHIHNWASLSYNQALNS